MKNFKRLLSILIAFIAITMLNPTGANAEWKQSGSSWWYSQGSSYATNWTKINGQWYYFDSNGYMKTGWVNDGGNWYYFYGEGTMAHDTKIDGYYLNSGGAWTTSIPVATTSYTSGNNNGSTTSAVGNTQSQTVYVSRQNIYHSSPHAHGMKYYSTMSRDEAESEGNRACKICY
jgi:hypothetical protein